MSILMTDDELARIRAELDADTQIGRMWRALKARTYANTAEPVLAQPLKKQLWGYVIWERIRDAASVYAIEPNAELGKWIHDRTMEAIHKDADDWIGDWFCARIGPPGEPRARLETAHIVSAIFEAYDLCPDLFTKEEREEIVENVRVKGMIPFRRFYNIVDHFNNHYCANTCGFAVAAVFCNDREAVKEAVAKFKFCQSLYNEDGYGETVQYSNYASLLLAHAWEVLVRYDSSLAEEIPLEFIANLMPWYAASFMYMKPLGGEHGDIFYARTLNFGDSAAVFRPTADLLALVSAKSANKVNAGLARWLLDTTYCVPEDGPDDLATFGLYNHFSYRTLIHLPDAAEPMTPSQANMPTYNVFKLGAAAIRDSWDDNHVVLGAQVGYETLNVAGHRHYDQNSFILAYNKERFFTDPGHCCYRLAIRDEVRSTEHHNIWDFFDADNNRYTQIGLVKARTTPMNRLVKYPEVDGFKILASDCAAAYGEHFKRAERVWITAFPDVMFMIDRVETDIPMKMVTHFSVNNRDGALLVNTDTPFRTRLADNGVDVELGKFPLDMEFSRNGQSVKFHTFPQEPGIGMERRWGYVHDRYHYSADHIGQGREGTAEVYDYITPLGTSHVMVYAFAMSGAQDISGWKMTSTKRGEHIITAPNNDSWKLTLDLEKEQWFELSR